ncbi:hypothetical protein ACTMU2_32250 [Cupriavidus basilensis]
MGHYADLAAEARGIGREAQDAYARKPAAGAGGSDRRPIRDEITPVALKRGGELSQDETPG